MYYVYFDSGTTNTRIYLIKNCEIRGEMKKSVGSKDVSVKGDRSILLSYMRELFDAILDKHDLKKSDIEKIYASGMVTSPFGIKEVPHISTPLSLEKLKDEIYTYYEPEYFKQEINLIRGIKTVSSDYKITEDNFHRVNNMRGEEIEIFGLLGDMEEKFSEGCYIFLPGSHTHIVEIKNGILTDILSTFSGELFHAIKKDTILSNSINEDLSSIDRSMIIKGAKKVEEAGINRALYLINTMQIFTDISREKRTSFLEGVITGEIVNLFNKNWPEARNILIYGDREVSEIYKILLQEICSAERILIRAGDEKTNYAVKGFLRLLKL